MAAFVSARNPSFQVDHQAKPQELHGFSFGCSTSGHNQPQGFCGVNQMDGSDFEGKPTGKRSGPHIERQLMAAFEKAAPPGRHTDGGGLYLKVDQSGARRWLLQITVKKR